MEMLRFPSYYFQTKAGTPVFSNKSGTPVFKKGFSFLENLFQI